MANLITDQGSGVTGRAEKVAFWKKLDATAIPDLREEGGRGKSLSEMTAPELHKFLNSNPMRMVYLFELRATEFHNWLESRKFA